MQRIPQALAVYRRELDRNPDDPGLYNRFAGFLEQNRVGDEVEQVYRRAVAQFQDNSWYDKLARWYARLPGWRKEGLTTPTAPRNSAPGAS